MKKFIIKETKESFRSIHELRQHALIEQIKDYTLIVKDDKQMTEGITKQYLEERLDVVSNPALIGCIGALILECTELNPWHPIETAPKDGRYLRLYDGVGQIDGRWFSYDESTDYGLWIGNEMRLEPTHWQELPEDPKK